MEFRVINPPDPFSEASFERDKTSPVPETRRPILAKSDGYDRLYHAILRYTLGEISGRSFLISGHRGAGKTTLVAHAIQDVLRSFRDTGRRPLYVRIHGPDLLPEAPEGCPAASAVRGERDEELCNVMRQMAIALYRAAADEYVVSYRERIRKRERSDVWQKKELYESAAQFAHDLEDCPGLETFREYWERVGLLDRGVLFARPENEDQGMLEVVALSVACQAYQVVSGKWEEQVSQSAAAARSSSLSFSLGAEVKNLLGPVAGVLSGGAVGAALLATKTNSIAAVVLALISAVVVSCTFTLASSQSRERKQNRQNTFSRDRTVSSLGRMLPLLLGHFRRAGLHPIFVVDELDKVHDLPRRMRDLVTYLKFFVSDRAFFCFLTDRDYMEYLERRTAGNTYAQEYSYFRERIPVFYEPRDLRTYLQSVFDASGAETGAVPENDGVDRALLSYSLLHRARLHPLDLRRQLTTIADRDGVARISDQELRDGRVKFELLFQLAVEWVLTSPDLQNAIRSSPRFAQLAGDALYYPSRSWEQGESHLDISDEAITAYLERRMAAAVEPEEQNGNPVPVPRTLSSRDGLLLIEAVRRLVYELQDPAGLVRQIKTKRTSPDEPSDRLLEYVPAGEKFQLLRRVEAYKYQWCFNAYGQSNLDIGVDEVLDESRVDIAFIEAMAHFVLDRSDGRVSLERLASELRLVAPTPPWSAVNVAINRLARLRAPEEDPKIGYPGMRDDGNCVWDYASRLRIRGDVLAQALGCAGALAQASPRETPGDRLLHGLRVLSADLALAATGEEALGQKIGSVYQSLREIMPALPESFPDLEGAGEEWIGAVAAMMTVALDSFPIAALNMRALAWKRWFSRFSSYFQDRATVFVPVFEDLWSRVDTSPPVPYDRPELLSPNLAEVTLASWTTMLCRALRTQPEVPSWVALTAAMQLGLPRLAAAIANMVPLLPPDPSVAPDPAQLEEWIRVVRSSSEVRRGVLLITADAYSLTSAWTPSPGYGVLSISASRLPELVHLATALRLLRAEDLGIEKVMIELSGDAGQLAAKLRNPPSANIPIVAPGMPTTTGLPCVYLVPEAPAESADKFPLPYVIAPANIEEAWTKARVAAAVAA